MTSGFAYFRLRDQYSKPELIRWAKVILEQRKSLGEIFVYFKHEETGSGPEFAAQLMKLLNK